MFYIVRNGKRHGPLTADQLRTHAATGRLLASDLITKDGDTRAKLVSDIPQLRKFLAPKGEGHQFISGERTVELPSVTPTGANASQAPRARSAANLIGHIWGGGKLAAAIGSVAGFIGDFLEPLAPINGYLCVGSFAASVILGCSWLALDREKRNDLDRWFPQQSFIFSSFLLVAFAGWFFLQRLNADQDRGLLGGNLAIVAHAQDALLDIKQNLNAIKADTAAIRDTLEQATEGKINLGSGYDTVAYHRDYQDRFVKDGGRWETLISQYQQRVKNAPANAMFHYLLSRAYDQNDQPLLAREAAEKGLRADGSFMWNRRFLLYFSVPPQLDEEWFLREEAIHYSLTSADVQQFASDDPAIVMQALVRVRSRFSADPVLHEDLNERHLSWHLSRAIRRWTYPNNQPFKRLIGLSNKSDGGQFNVEVLDVKTGIDAMRLIPEIQEHVLIEEGTRAEMTKSTMLKVGIGMPPIAVKIRFTPLVRGISATDISNRSFQLVAHSGTQHPAVLKEFFGGGAQVDPDRRMGLSNCEADVNHVFDPAGFWVYFFSHAAPWIEQEETLFVATWNLEKGKNFAAESDWVEITAPRIGR